MKYSTFTSFKPIPPNGAGHADPRTDAIQTEIERLIQSKEWQENAAKNNIFKDCNEPSLNRRSHVPPAAVPTQKFTMLNLGKRQRNS